MTTVAKCRIHPKQKLITTCPACLGSIRSKAKKKSSRKNGKLGGRGKTRAKRLRKRTP